MSEFQFTDYHLLLNPVVSTSANQTSDSIDMRGFGAVKFVGTIGTAEATATASMQVECTATTSTDWTNITSAVAASTGGASDGLLVVNVANGGSGAKRFLRTVITNATTANIEYGGVYAERYRARVLPTIASTTGDLLADDVYITNPTTAA